MLNSLITSKTRLKLLFKFFSNVNCTAYLRGLAEEFNESTNAIRLELNNLARAGLLESRANGRTIEYKANQDHPLFPEINNIVLKHFGLYNLAENVVKALGNVELAFITGDYANGKDSGIIDLVLIGDIDQVFFKQLIEKAEKKINRKVRSLILTGKEYKELKNTLQPEKALMLWKAETAVS